LKQKKSKHHWKKFGVLIFFLLVSIIIGLEFLKLVPLNKYAKQACYELIECNENNIFTWEKEIKQNFTIEGTCKCKNRTLNIIVTKNDIDIINDIIKPESYQGNMVDNISSSGEFRVLEIIEDFVFFILIITLIVVMLFQIIKVISDN